MASQHPILKRWLPERAFQAIKKGTRQWLAECRCGFKRDYWDAGGVRYKAAGKEYCLMRCPNCGNATMHNIRRKTEAERIELPGED